MTSPAPPTTPPPTETTTPPTPPGTPTTTTPGTPATEPKPTTQRRQKIGREAILVIALVVTTGELALVAVLGSWSRWLIIHGAIAVIAMIIMFFRLGNRRRGTSTGNGTGRNRTLPGIFGRNRGTGTGATGATGTRRRGISALLGRRGQGTATGSGTRAGTGSSHRPHLAGLLGKRGHGNPGTPGNKRGGRLGNLFGGTGRNTPGAGGTRRSGSGDHSGTSSTPRRIGTGRNGYRNGSRVNNDPDGHRTKTGRDPHTGNPIKRGWRDFKDGWDEAGPKSKPPKDGDPETPEDKPQEDPKGKQEDSKDKPRQDPKDGPQGEEPNAHDPRIPIEPEVPIPTSRGREQVKTQGAPSLQAWGRCLPTVTAALAEKQQEFRRMEAELGVLAQAVSRLRTQGEDELPASPKLVSLLTDVEASLARLPVISELLGRMAGYAEALPSIYRSEHAGDEDRLDGTRGGRDREKRADVTVAEQDT